MLLYYRGARGCVTSCILPQILHFGANTRINALGPYSSSTACAIAILLAVLYCSAAYQLVINTCSDFYGEAPGSVTIVLVKSFC